MRLTINSKKEDFDAIISELENANVVPRILRLNECFGTKETLAIFRGRDIGPKAISQISRIAASHPKAKFTLADGSRVEQIWNRTHRDRWKEVKTV